MLSVSATNQPNEYEITYLVRFSVTSGDKELLPPQEVSTTRTYSFTEQLLLAKGHEEDILREDMAHDLAERVMRLLSQPLGSAAMSVLPAAVPADPAPGAAAERHRSRRAGAAAGSLRHLSLTLVARGESIPGSYWGESEAGLKGERLYARLDTPVHSVLHEASHYICMTPERRARLDRDAGGDDDEESAVCYLQVLLGGRAARSRPRAPDAGHG